MIEEPTITWLKSVKSAIENIQQEYCKNRGMLLTEGDLECHLFNWLLKDENLKGFHNSKNDSIFSMKEVLKTTFVHSQVTWFKQGQKSGFEVDLTIGEPSKLEVINIELFEEYTNKGFAYDGPCIAIELKFIRNIEKANSYGHEDYLKLRDRLIPAKIENIIDKKYQISNQNNIAFYSIVGCKDKDIFEKAIFYLGKHLADASKPCPENLFVCIFYQDKIIFDKSEIIKHYKLKASL